jgi:SWI/SNF-related matrix-associated actin-dependent regulator 1 of chromatin subfamily A
LFEKRNSSVAYPASVGDATAFLKRECDEFVSAAEDAAPRAVSSLKLDAAAATVFLCEESLRLCKKGGVAHEQARALELAAARAKEAEEKAAAEAAEREAARQRELEAAAAAAAAESLALYSDKYSVHSGLTSGHFRALGLPGADADKLELMVTSNLQAKAEAEAEAAAAAQVAAEAEAARQRELEAAAAAQSAAGASEDKHALGGDGSAAAGEGEGEGEGKGEGKGIVSSIVDSIGSFFSEPPSSPAPDM